MTVEQIVFLAAAFLTLAAAGAVVTVRNLFHSALHLVLALFGVAVLYVLLQAGFFAVVQVVIYIGAIAILLIFAIMLTRNVMSETRTAVNENWSWALFVAIVVLAGLMYMFNRLGPALAIIPMPLDPRIDPVQYLGAALIAPEGYVLPFELASLLLLAALIGALVVAWEKRP